jgi:hypothetical protein
MERGGQGSFPSLFWARTSPSADEGPSLTGLDHEPALKCSGLKTASKARGGECSEFPRGTYKTGVGEGGGSASGPVEDGLRGTGEVHSAPGREEARTP